MYQLLHLIYLHFNGAFSQKLTCCILREFPWNHLGLNMIGVPCTICPLQCWCLWHSWWGITSVTVPGSWCSWNAAGCSTLTHMIQARQVLQTSAESSLSFSSHICGRLSLLNPISPQVQSSTLSPFSRENPCLPTVLWV